MDVRGVGEAAEQVSVEVGMGAVVLGGGAMPAAVGQDGLQFIAFAAGQGGMLVKNKTGGALGHTGGHDFGFVAGSGEALLPQDRSSQDFTACGIAPEGIAAAEEKVIGVAGVGGLETAGESSEPGVKAERS